MFKRISRLRLDAISSRLLRENINSVEEIQITKAYYRQVRWRKKHWKEIRQQFMDANPHCHWCGQEVVYFYAITMTKMPGNFATIDHLYDRFDPRRYRAYSDLEDLVLACNSCNLKRGKKRTEMISPEDREKRRQLATTRPSGTPRVMWLGIGKEEDITP